MRAAACETKQLSLLCPFFLSVVVGKVVSKFAIKMAARTIVFLRFSIHLKNSFWCVMAGFFIWHAVAQGWMKVLRFYNIIYLFPLKVYFSRDIYT